MPSGWARTALIALRAPTWVAVSAFVAGISSKHSPNLEATDRRVGVVGFVQDEIGYLPGSSVLDGLHLSAHTMQPITGGNRHIKHANVGFVVDDKIQLNLGQSPYHSSGEARTQVTTKMNPLVIHVEAATSNC